MCLVKKKECMSCQCIDCEDLIDNYAPRNPTDTVRYQQWQNNDKTERVAIKGTISDVFAELKRQLRDFFYSHLCQAQAGCLNGYFDFKV